jgi:ATP-dependent DNA helicase PIF1
MPSFITHHKQTTAIQQNNTLTNPHLLQGKQLQAYSTVQQHFSNNVAEPLHMIISGTAGTGKSFLINCLKALLRHTVKVAAPTGVAAFNVQGCTSSSLTIAPSNER